MMNKIEALALIKEKVENENLQRHMLAVGAIMKQLAQHFSENSELWEVTGILHDVDLGTTEDPAIHGKLGASWLKEMGMPLELVHAVLAHADHEPCESKLDYALYCVDQISGLIIACALVKERKLSNVTPKTVRKRFKEKRFAAGANREAILRCSDLGLELPEFIEISLSAMQSIAQEIGL